jgi:hypothetical protein
MGTNATYFWLDSNLPMYISDVQLVYNTLKKTEGTLYIPGLDPGVYSRI